MTLLTVQPEDLKMSNQVVPTQKSTAMAQTLGLGNVTNVFDWLIERFGPALSEILLDYLTKKSVNNAVLPSADVQGAFDVKGLAALFIERFGPALIEKTAEALDQRTDLVSKLAASVLRQHSDQIINMLLEWLKTPEAQQIFTDAVAKTLATA